MFNLHTHTECKHALATVLDKSMRSLDQNDDRTQFVQLIASDTTQTCVETKTTNGFVVTVLTSGAKMLLHIERGQGSGFRRFKPEFDFAVIFLLYHRLTRTTQHNMAKRSWFHVWNFCNLHSRMKKAKEMAADQRRVRVGRGKIECMQGRERERGKIYPIGTNLICLEENRFSFLFPMHMWMMSKKRPVLVHTKDRHRCDIRPPLRSKQVKLAKTEQKK